MRVASASAPQGAAHAFLTVEEAAALARVSPKRLRNLMAAGVLREGVHFSRPRGLRPRVFRAPLLAWLEGREPETALGVSRVRGRPRCKIDLSPVADVLERANGL